MPRQKLLCTYTGSKQRSLYLFSLGYSSGCKIASHIDQLFLWHQGWGIRKFTVLLEIQNSPGLQLISYVGHWERKKRLQRPRSSNWQWLQSVGGTRRIQSTYSDIPGKSFPQKILVHCCEGLSLQGRQGRVVHKEAWQALDTHSCAYHMKMPASSRGLAKSRGWLRCWMTSPTKTMDREHSVDSSQFRESEAGVHELDK